MLGEEGLKLVRELKRFFAAQQIQLLQASQTTQTTISLVDNNKTRQQTQLVSLPPHDTESVRNVQSEMRHLFDQVQLIYSKYSLDSAENSASDIVTSVSPDDFAMLNIASLLISRNKRCLLAYHYHRMEYLCQVVMEMRALGGGLKQAPASLRTCLSAHEQLFYRDYSRLLHKYKINFDDLVDLTGNLVPPQSSFVQVRVLRDLEIECVDGSRRVLSRGHCDFLRRCDVEPYIEQGYLLHVA